MKTTESKSQVDDQEIAAAIREAEKDTSGEIRVFISQQTSTDPVEDARREFHRLGMSRTPMRNAVLLYFVPASNRLALFADEGIHLRCGPAFWTETAATMEQQIRDGKFTDAIKAGIQKVGAELARHFPKHPGDRNDLPDDVVRK